MNTQKIEAEIDRLLALTDEELLHEIARRLEVQDSTAADMLRLRVMEEEPVIVVSVDKARQLAEVVRLSDKEPLTACAIELGLR